MFAFVLIFIMASVFLLYNMIFFKYFSIKEGLENNSCDIEKNTLIYKNNAAILEMKSQVDKIMPLLSKLTSSDSNQSAQLAIIQAEINKAKGQAESAKAETDSKMKDFNNLPEIK